MSVDFRIERARMSFRLRSFGFRRAYRIIEIRGDCEYWDGRVYRNLNLARYALRLRRAGDPAWQYIFRSARHV